MKLAELYSLESGLKLGETSAYETYYPLDHSIEKCILIHSFGGKIVDTPQGKQIAFPSKIYDYYNEVVAILKPIVEPLGYRFYQIGAPGEPLLPGVTHLVGRTTIHQCTYIVKRCALLIGNDSLWAHQRGSFGKPMVVCYGGTSLPHHPFWNNRDKSILIESHRFGNKPSYQSMENPKTINLIPPEQVANAALSLLDQPQISRRSLSMGVLFNQPIIELIPDVVMDPRIQTPVPPVIRMDLHFDEENLGKNLQLRKCQIITNREIDINLLARLKPNIAAIRMEIDKLSPDWIKKVKRLGVQCAVMAVEKDDAKVQQMRLDYYDVLQPTGFDRFVPTTLDDWKADVAKYTQSPLDPAIKLDTLSFKTNKFILSNGKVYLSKAHWKAGIAAASTDANTGTVIDDPLLWEDAAHLYVFKQ
jgi:glycosyl transferase family 9 (putative heptosyltransferase)